MARRSSRPSREGPRSGARSGLPAYEGPPAGRSGEAGIRGGGGGRRLIWAGGGGGPSSWKWPRPPEGATCLSPVLLARGQRCCLPARAALSPPGGSGGRGGAGGGEAPGAAGRPLPPPPPLGRPGPSPALLAAARPDCDTSAPPARPAAAPYCPPAPSHHPQQPQRPASCLSPVCRARVSAARGVTLRMAEVVAGAEMPPCGAGLSQDWFGGPDIPELPLLEFCPHVVIKTPTVWLRVGADYRDTSFVLV